MKDTFSNEDKAVFEELLMSCKGAVERFVYYKMPTKHDGDDVLQEVYLKAYEQFKTLKERNCFKPWLITIAVNKCNDFYRKRAADLSFSIDEITVSVTTQSRNGLTVRDTVRETLDDLSGNDKQILYLYYIKNKSQADIAKLLNIPLGTVKSRLYTAKKNFKCAYPYPPRLKGDISMKTLPDFIPEYRISKLDKAPFEVKWEETMGWFIIPKLNEKCSWAMYDYPLRKRSESYDLKVIGKASVHGIEGVEILAKETKKDGSSGTDRTFIAQLTDTHTRFLSETHFIGDVKNHYTFLDGDEFLQNWGFGEDNCGNDIHIKSKGMIKREGNMITCPNIPSVLDIVGCYNIEIGGKNYETILVLDIELYNSGVMSETYLDKKGRTILWRRFNRDDWKISHYKKKWSDQLPVNEKLIINGETYVHWYDCITDYIL